jgi:hypothetical protein
MTQEEFYDEVHTVIGKAIAANARATDVVHALVMHAAHIIHYNRVPNATDEDLLRVTLKAVQNTIDFCRAKDSAMSRPPGARLN